MMFGLETFNTLLLPNPDLPADESLGATVLPLMVKEGNAAHPIAP